jgi:hypothetical protein
VVFAYRLPDDEPGAAPIAVPWLEGEDPAGWWVEDLAPGVAHAAPGPLDGAGLPWPTAPPPSASVFELTRRAAPPR